VIAVAWDVDAMNADIARAVADYTSRIAQRSVVIERDLVTVVMRLDGVLSEVDIDARALRRHGAARLGELVTEAIRAAEDATEAGRDEVAATVTYRGHNVVEVMAEMATDPAAAARRLSVSW
jgi:DNA-binding protein YbaB